MKKVLDIFSAPESHWVGDGFPVRSLLSYRTLERRISPFLLLDYAGPAQFPPTSVPRGVGRHPHRGFETVTIVYAGEVAHRDSAGNGGIIAPGDVQWMTAGSGIVHEEFHSPDFTQRGGVLEMVQLWINLPSRDKMVAPSYQAIVDSEIPSVALSNGAGRVRVIAGSYEGHTGPARPFTPMNVWDIRLEKSHSLDLRLQAGHTVAVFVLHGEVQIGASDLVQEAQVALLEREGDLLAIRGQTDAVLLVLSGEPINEPIVGHGPFVMNSRAEINQAIDDFNEGRFVR
jgi:redox-sensitive bicupin YhaK (pirin superfamily)